MKSRIVLCSERKTVFTKQTFTLTSPVKNVDIGNITSQGYWFFAGTMSLKQNVVVSKAATSISAIDDGEKLVMTCSENYSRNENNLLVCNSIDQSMSYREETYDNYRLDISFPAEYNGSDFTELVDFIDIEIRSWQSVGD